MKSSNNRAAMLPEWTAVEAVMLAWPHESTDWLPWLQAIQQDYVELAIAISQQATPLILCQDAEHKALIRQQLNKRCHLSPLLIEVPYNDTWCRDYGPVATGTQDSPALLDFQFQGWGDKYEATLDNQVSLNLQSLWHSPLRSVALQLEGGSIETDGQGALLTTRHCLLESGRNDNHSQEEIEALLQQELGVEHLLWISEGSLQGDDTDSHIDNLVRFCDPNTLAYAACTRPDDEQYSALQKMAEQVQALRKANGEPYRCIPLEIPSVQLGEDGKRLPGSYANFLIVNDAVLVPVFGCAEDALALNALQQCFPDKTISPVPGSNLIRQFGGPHCATMQLPRGVLSAGWQDGISS